MLRRLVIRRLAIVQANGISHTEVDMDMET